MHHIFWRCGITEKNAQGTWVITSHWFDRQSTIDWLFLKWSTIDWLFLWNETRDRLMAPTQFFRKYETRRTPHIAPSNGVVFFLVPGPCRKFLIAVQIMPGNRSTASVEQSTRRFGFWRADDTLITTSGCDRIISRQQLSDNYKSLRKYSTAFQVITFCELGFCLGFWLEATKTETWSFPSLDFWKFCQCLKKSDILWIESRFC